MSKIIARTRITFVVYENLKRITIPLGREHIIYLTTDVEADHSRIIYEIIKIISNL